MNCENRLLSMVDGSCTLWITTVRDRGSFGDFFAVRRKWSLNPQIIDWKPASFPAQNGVPARKARTDRRTAARSVAQHLQQEIHVVVDFGHASRAVWRSGGRRAAPSCGRGRRSCCRFRAATSWVSSLASAIATWRGRAIARERFFECMSDDPDLVVVGDGLLDVLDRDLPVLHRQQVAQRFLGHGERDVLAVEARVGDAPASARPRVRARWSGCAWR